MTFSTNAKMKAFKLKQCSNVELLPPGGAKRVAITSFPGSGNTWARHLLHMGTGEHSWWRFSHFYGSFLGIWTGNARSSNKLKDAGWQGEDISCMEGSVIAIKTHKWHTFKVWVIDYCSELLTHKTLFSNSEMYLWSCYYLDTKSISCFGGRIQPTNDK